VIFWRRAVAFQSTRLVARNAHHRQLAILLGERVELLQLLQVRVNTQRLVGDDATLQRPQAEAGGYTQVVVAERVCSARLGLHVILDDRRAAALEPDVHRQIVRLGALEQVVDQRDRERTARLRTQAQADTIAP
jgi:hypothetical protein